MSKRKLIHRAMMIIAMTLPATAFAEATPKATAAKPAATKPEKRESERLAVAPERGSTSFTWSAMAGLGYDSNAFQAPRSAYVDYAALPIGSNPVVVPQKKSGLFIPFELEAEIVQTHDLDTRLRGAATADGSLYPAGSVSDADEYNVRLRGGYEFVMGRKEKSENTFYVGALAGKHKQIYVDHDSGLGKTTTLSGIDISTRYSYTNFGIEADYEHRVGNVNYGLNGKYLLYNYDNPVAVSELDHNYYRLGADASFPVVQHMRLSVSFDHSVRDYANRHSRNAQGRILNANPLALFTYNSVGASLRNRISPQWLLYVDLDHSQRSDGYVSYDDYEENRFGVRVLFEQERIKGRLSLHHWARDYPNGFAFDVAGQGTKNYSGNDLKFKAELEQTKNSALWAELIHDFQSTTDLRYDYVRTQIMAGMSWAY
jgi:hypothetical protein